MARPFATKDAKRLIKEHKEIQQRLNATNALEQQYREKILSAANNMVANEVLAVLKGVPVEEVNRNKKGIKTKPLRDYGYTSIAELSTASVYQIASVKGISEDTAYTIKLITNELVDQARKNTKIRISVDKKTPAATALVTEIAVFKKVKPIAQACREMINKNSRQIEYAIEDFAPATSGLKWLFTSAVNKQKATVGYKLLDSLLYGEYGREAKEILASADFVQRIEESDAWKDFEGNSIQFFTILEDLAPGVIGTDDLMYGLPEDLAKEIQEQYFFKEGLLCTLRRYQEWGVKYALHQERVLLGDEMGLGKTKQTIATMVSLKNTGATHFVVVCPASVITNWYREIEKQSRLRVTKVHGSGRTSDLRYWIQTGGVAVTTYETTAHFKLAEDFKYSLCVVDEAHYIKNPEAKRSINVRNICKKAERLLFMTGTALENKVDEMISLIQILQPTIASQIRGMAFMAAAPQFREKVAPVYYRRKREDVLTELPELIESKEWCTLSAQEEDIYERTVLAKNYAGVRRVSWNVDELKYSSKAKRLLEIIDEAESDGRKVIVFSFFLDTIRKVCELLMVLLLHREDRK